MTKRKYHINPDTLLLERDEEGFGYWVLHIGIFIITGAILGLSAAYLYYSFYPTPKERHTVSAYENLEAQYEVMGRRLEQMNLVLKDMEERDANLYRVLFGAEPIPLEVRSGAARKMSYYEHIEQTTNSRLAAEVARKADGLENAMYVQTVSYDTIISMAKNQEERLKSIPAIQPVLNQDLTRVASGYGVRIDPVYHVKKFHHGMDFTAPVGTDVYATGDGVVSFTGWMQGYGNTMVVNHGFGYSTLYAHLYKAVARTGQRVKRGDIIALVGNSGKSTGPHLHYEVRINDRPVDPRNYYFYDLSPEQYDLMVQLSNNYGTMLD